MTTIKDDKPVDLARTLELLGVDALPAPGESMEGFAISGMSKMLDLYGEDWVKQHRKRLYQELEFLEQTYGISGYDKLTRFNAMMRKIGL